MRSLVQSRVFWIVVTIALVGLAAASFWRGEPKFAVLYLLIGIYAVARAAGWWPRSRR